MRSRGSSDERPRGALGTAKEVTRHYRGVSLAMSPHVSLIMTVKNGMPYLPEALESVASQAYRDFELVIQDGASTDETVEVLERYCDDPRLRGRAGFESEPDAHIGEARARVLRRCRGAIIGTLDSDNLLEPGALSVVGRYFAEDSTLAALYGAQTIVNASGEPIWTFRPRAFDLVETLECALVPPFGSAYFSAAWCGDNLLPALDIPYCWDFETWLRVAHLKIISVPEVLASTRISGNSLSCTPELYDEFCRDRLAVLERFFSRYDPGDPLIQALRGRSWAGVYLWAAESVKFHAPSALSDVLFTKHSGAPRSSIPGARAAKSSRGARGAPPRWRRCPRRPAARRRSSRR